MAFSIDVNLPRDHQARFPDRCVVCQEFNPGSHVTLFTGTIGGWTWLLQWWGKPFVVKAPACNRCAWRLHGRRALSLLVTIATCALAYWFMWPPVRESVPGSLHKWTFLGLAFACGIPQFTIELFWAHPFCVTANSKSVTYEFLSLVDAWNFAILNRDAAWVKINGSPRSAGDLKPMNPSAHESDHS